MNYEWIGKIMKMCEQILNIAERIPETTRSEIHFNAIQLLVRHIVPPLIYDHLEKNHKTKIKNKRIESVIWLKIWSNFEINRDPEITISAKNYFIKPTSTY